MVRGYNWLAWKSSDLGGTSPWPQKNAVWDSSSSSSRFFAVLFIVNRRQKLAAEPADLILMNGKIVTVDERFPSAGWIAVHGDRIDALGSDPNGYKRHVGDGTEIIDLGGALTIPGLIESHGHFTGLGQSKTILDLTKARSWDEHRRPGRRGGQVGQAGRMDPGPGLASGQVGPRARAQRRRTAFPRRPEQGHSREPGPPRARQRPLVARQRQGHGIVQDHGDDERPRRAARSSATPRATPSAPSSKRPKASSVPRPARSAPKKPPAQARKLVELASRECLVHGVTTFHDAGTGFCTVDLYKKMAEEGALPVRLYVMLSADSKALAGQGTGLPDDRRGRQPPDRPDDQAAHRRRPRRPRRLAARALRRPSPADDRRASTRNRSRR